MDRNSGCWTCVFSIERPTRHIYIGLFTGHMRNTHLPHIPLLSLTLRSLRRSFLEWRQENLVLSPAKLQVKRQWIWHLPTALFNLDACDLTPPMVRSSLNRLISQKPSRPKNSVAGFSVPKLTYSRRKWEPSIIPATHRADEMQISTSYRVFWSWGTASTTG